MIRVTNQYFWNIIFLLFFVCLVIMSAIILQTEARLSLYDLTVYDMSIIALASFRLMHLFAYDSITKFFREQFYDAKVTKAGKVTLYKPASGPRRTIVDLISCPWCFGIWTTATILFFYLATQWAVFPIYVLAISAVVTFFAKISFLIENKIAE